MLLGKITINLLESDIGESLHINMRRLKKHLKEMVKIGAVRKSQSPWASAVVLVRKKTGELRFCIDLRKLNAWTI